MTIIGQIDTWSLMY